MAPPHEKQSMAPPQEKQRMGPAQEKQSWAHVMPHEPPLAAPPPGVPVPCRKTLFPAASTVSGVGLIMYLFHASTRLASMRRKSSGFTEFVPTLPAFG
jgi:hypothetical protein